MRRWIPAALTLCLPLAAAAAEKPYTLEQILRAPVATSLVSAPHARRVAWVVSEEGRRNIWAAEAPGFAARKLTAYEQDDGQDLTQLTFSDDGELIVYVRGGDPWGSDKNDAGEAPNPTSSPAGVEITVFVVPFAGGAARKIDAGTAPAISSRGTLAYVRDGKLWLAPARGEGKPQNLVVRGQVGEPRWSPDGGTLAFTSDRGDHAFIGLHDVAAATVRYLAPSVDRDFQPVWSRDGKRLAFVRSPAQPQDTPSGWFTAPDRPDPWAIWIADARTADTRELWRSTLDGAGSYPNLMPTVAWAGDRIVFATEADGWQRLASIPAAGGTPVALTPAGCETESFIVANKDVVFVSNCGDVDRRHLSRVPAAGGKVERITRGEGIEWSPVALGDGGMLAYLGADARRPARAFVVDGDRPKEVTGVPAPADYPAAALVAPEPVVIRAPDGLEVHGQLFRPRGAAGRRPAVIYLHGGPIRQMLLGFHYRPYYSHAYAVNQFFAQRGYVVLALNYRSGIGYGQAFRMAPGRAGRGATEYQDVVAAGRWLGARPDVDPRRIALWGGSYGGYLTALGLARNSDLFAAGADLHGVHDWSIAPWAGKNNSPEVTRLARESSPVSSVLAWRSPVLFVTGDDDRNVPVGQTVDLVARLRERNVPVEQVIFPDEIHDFLLYKNQLAAYRAVSEFLDRRLTPRP